MNIGLLNMASLLLGLGAWFLPIFGLLTRKNQKRKTVLYLSLFSLAFCALAIWFQLSYSHHLVRIADWSALADTSETVKQVSGILLLMTLLLNGCRLFLSERE